MTKLEQKLIELGYEYYKQQNYNYIYKKKYSDMYIELNNDKTKIEDAYVFNLKSFFRRTAEVEHYLHTITLLKLDLEELEQCQD